MCAWLNGNNFEQTFDPNYETHGRIARISKLSLPQYYYKAAFKSNTLIKCHECVPISPYMQKIRKLRKHKYIHANYLQFLYKGIRVEELVLDEEDVRRFVNQDSLERQKKLAIEIEKDEENNDNQDIFKEAHAKATEITIEKNKQ